MQLRVLIFFTALNIAFSAGLISYIIEPNWQTIAVHSLVALIVGFWFFNFLFERFIYGRIKLIYKMIHNLKLGKNLKAAIGHSLSDDPIRDVELEVRAWAKAKKNEIETLTKEAHFRRDFLANLAHEVKTPLFAVQGYITSIQEGVEDPETLQKFIDKASKNLDRLSNLILELDEISKLERGETSLKFERFDLHTLIREVLEALELKAEKYKIQLVFKPRYDVETNVYADREKIRQVLDNLIVNSLKYGKTGGKTSIKIYTLPEQFLVEVNDDGPGIDPQFLPRLFERFYRVETSRSREIAGSGLGLAIVKHILEAHEQTINVRSTKELGTTFSFTLQKAN